MSWFQRVLKFAGWRHQNDAVNAGNLDGGMSSYMVYKGEVITSPYMLYFNGRRTVATSFIVSKQKDK